MATSTVRTPVTSTGRFTTMGTRAEVTVVDGDPALLRLARARLEALEARWSRFRTGSDTTALNRAAGTWVPIAPETVLLLERAVAGARATEGRFDPTVGAAMVAHGYDRTFAEVADHAAGVVPEARVDGAWPAIEIDPDRCLGCLPVGTSFDPGGLGKGLAADLVASELGDQAAGLLVNLGGDLRVRGLSPDPAGWVIAIDDPLDPSGTLGRIALPSGGVATSSTQRRRWRTAAGPAHHIIDPTTGRPSTSGVAAVTVAAGEAWWAEVQATSLLLQGPRGLDAVDEHVHAAMVMVDGSLHATGAMAEALR